MASKNARETAKSAALKSYIDQMNELAVSEGVKIKEEVEEYFKNASSTVKKGNMQ